MKAGTPLVSIIMPTYNCGAYIEDSIRSVIAQTVTDWELQIVDDCSTDNTREVVERLAAQEKCIHYTCFSRNQGPAAARTEALRRADGKYIAFLDSDDLWEPDKLERQLAFMEKTGAKFSATAYDQFDESGTPLPTVCLPPHKTTYRKMLLLSNPIGNSTVMYDQSVLGKFEVPPIRNQDSCLSFLSANGLFRKQRNISIGGAIINIVVSLLLMKPLGIAGILAGTAVSQVYYWVARSVVALRECLNQSWRTLVFYA